MIHTFDDKDGKIPRGRKISNSPQETIKTLTDHTPHRP